MANETSNVEEFISAVSPEKRRRDAGTLLDLMARVTGETPFLWGSIVGFGNYHYKYPSGREGDAGAAAFAPRKANMVIYLSDGVAAHEAQLKQLGEHTTGLICVYVKDLDRVDLTVLEAIISDSYRTLTSDAHGRALAGGSFTAEARVATKV